MIIFVWTGRFVKVRESGDFAKGDGLITRRSKVQILSPLPREFQGLMSMSRKPFFVSGGFIRNRVLEIVLPVDAEHASTTVQTCCFCLLNSVRCGRRHCEFTRSAAEPGGTATGCFVRPHAACRACVSIHTLNVITAGCAMPKNTVPLPDREPVLR